MVAYLVQSVDCVFLLLLGGAFWQQVPKIIAHRGVVQTVQQPRSLGVNLKNQTFCVQHHDSAIGEFMPIPSRPDQHLRPLALQHFLTVRRGLTIESLRPLARTNSSAAALPPKTR